MTRIPVRSATRRCVIAATFAAISSASGFAQHTVQTDPSIGTTTVVLGPDSHWVWQSFLAPSTPYLRGMSFDFWFTGSQSEYLFTEYGIELASIDDETHFPTGTYLSGGYLDQYSDGRVTLQVHDVHIPSGASMFIWIMSDWSEQWWEALNSGLCSSGSDPCVSPLAYTKVTTADAYAGGVFSYHGARQDGDLAFSAEFVTPEPVTMLLLGTGMAGLGMASRRRRKLMDQTKV